MRRTTNRSNGVVPTIEAPGANGAEEREREYTRTDLAGRDPDQHVEFLTFQGTIHTYPIVTDNWAHLAN